VFCSGFLVAEDIVVTAGHCYDESDIANTRFVFGFVMLDATTPETVVNANQVYSGIEVISQVLTDTAEDYAVVRIDRPVTAPGAVPLEFRQSGTIAIGTQIGVIGHPTGLPTKIAFGEQTTVRGNSESAIFTANLDTYGGNSGSPVFDAATGVVEGILVRGAADFIDTGTCFVSNMLTDAEAAEASTRATVWAPFVTGGEKIPGCHLVASADIPSGRHAAGDIAMVLIAAITLVGVRRKIC